MGLPVVNVMPEASDPSGERFVSLRHLVARRRQDAFRSGRVQEVMSTSDFTYMADLIDRGTLVSYLDQSIPITYPTIGYRRDTTTLARAGSGNGTDYRLNAARLVPQVDEGAEYLTIDPSDESFDAHTYKYGATWSLTWEAWLSDNRDLGLLAQYPQTWGLSARYTQQYLFTDMYADSATLFTGAHGNLMSGAGSQLDAANLAIAVHAIRNFTDPSGNVSPYAGPLYLVVPTTLELTARALVESQVVITGDALTMPANNSVRNTATVVVDHFLEAVSAANGTTAWYLFKDPRLCPALRYGFLRGYETPSVYVKEADARMLMGGASDPFDGAFLNDDVEFKVRFTWGQDEVDWRGGYKSTGEAEAA
jgi:hypothetical protein